RHDDASFLEVARDALVGSVFLPVTADAITHVQIHVALCNRLVRDVTVARGTLDVRADVRRMIEAHVRLMRVAVDALPVEIESLLLQRGHLLDQRTIGGDRAVTRHADVDARQTGDGPLLHRLMTVLGALEALVDVCLVRELERLYRRRPDAEEIVDRL